MGGWKVHPITRPRNDYLVVIGNKNGNLIWSIERVRVHWTAAWGLIIIKFLRSLLAAEILLSTWRLTLGSLQSQKEYGEGERESRISQSNNLFIGKGLEKAHRDWTTQILREGKIWRRTWSDA